MAYTAKQLQDMGYGGYAGWADTEANNDFNATGGSGKKTNTSGTGTGGFDWKGYLDQQTQQQNDLLAKQKADTDTRFASNKSELEGLNNDYAAAVPTAQANADSKYHVTDLLNFTNALNTRIQNLKGNNDSVGAEGVASADQVDKAVNTKYLPNFLTASDNLGRASTLAQNDVNTALDPYKTHLASVTDRIARETTGYSTEQQNELDALIQKMQTTGTLAAADMARATALAQTEQQYKNQLALNQQQADLAKANPSNSDRYVSLGNGLYDTQTGQIIQKPAAAGASGW